MKEINKKTFGLLAIAVISIVGIAVVVSAEEADEAPPSIYDVNRNGVVNFQDAGLCWTYVRDEIDDPYGNLLYDVNCDGAVDWTDCMDIWYNRD